MSNILDELNKATAPVEDIKVDVEAIDDILHKQSEGIHLEDEMEQATTDIPHEEVTSAAVSPNDKDKRSAKRYVRAFNVVLKAIFPTLYSNSLLKPGDTEIIKQYVRKKELDPKLDLEEAVRSDEKLYHSLKRYEALSKAIDELPLTEDEQNEIAEPLSELLAENPNWHISPGGALVLSVAIVMLPRIEPFFPNAKKIFGKLFE